MGREKDLGSLNFPLTLSQGIEEFSGSSEDFQVQVQEAIEDLESQIQYDSRLIVLSAEEFYKGHWVLTLKSGIDLTRV